MGELTAAGPHAAPPTVTNRSLVKPTYVVIFLGFAIMLVPFPGTGLLGGLIAGFCGVILGIVNMVRGAVGTGIFQVILGVIGTPIVYAISWLLFIGIHGGSG